MKALERKLCVVGWGTGGCHRECVYFIYACEWASVVCLSEKAEYHTKNNKMLLFVYFFRKKV